MFKETRTPKSGCLNCGKEMDATFSIDGDHTPNKGDISICLYCGHIMSFDAQLALRELNDEEIRWVAGNKMILKAQWARQQSIKDKKL